MDTEEEKIVENKSQLGCMDDLSIALVMFEGAEEQDIVGPFEMFFWMSLFEAVPPDRRPIGEPDFAVDFISESEFADYFYPKVPRRGKSSLWLRPSRPIACRLACNLPQISVMTMPRLQT